MLSGLLSPEEFVGVTDVLRSVGGSHLYVVNDLPGLILANGLNGGGESRINFEDQGCSL
jgi:hypothetical protein